MRARLFVGLCGMMVLIVMTSWTESAFGQSRDINDYVLLARESVALKNPVVVGNIGVNETGGELSLGRGSFMADGFEAVGDFATIGIDASVYDLYANSVSAGFDPSRVRGVGPLPVSLPLIDPLPSFPTFSCGTDDLIVGKDESITLVAGSFGAVNFKDGSSVNLAGGTYNMCSLDLGKDVILTADAGAAINIVGDLRIGNNSHIGAAAGVDTMEINVSGSSVNFGKDTVVLAWLDARFAEVALDNGDFFGRVIADTAHSDFGLTLTLPEPEPTPTPIIVTPTPTPPAPTPTPLPECVPEPVCLGCPSVCRLIPYYEVGDSLATIIGFTNTSVDEYMLVHVTVFDTESIEELDFDLCLSEHDFGYLVLQKGPASEAQKAELASRGDKAEVLSLDAGDLTSSTGYVTICARRIDNCVSRQVQSPQESPWLFAWTILQDVGSGFFATEVPSPAADAHLTTGEILSAGCQLPVGGVATRVEECLIPPNRRVGARYDVNPVIGASSSVIVWLSDNAFGSGARCSGSGSPPAAAAACTSDSQNECKCPAHLRGEDEGRVSTRIPLTREVNVLDVASLGGIGILGGDSPPQYRGVLEFRLPASQGGAGFIFSLVDQDGLHFRETFIGYDTGDTNQP